MSDAPISASELLSGASAPGLSRNRWFAPDRAASGAPQLNGTLRLTGTTMSVLSDAPDGRISNPVDGKDTTYFPDVSISFLTVGPHLVPSTQDVIRNGTLPDTRSYWDVIVQPGRVWTQAGDRGWHRASFPFALVNSIEGETHTGVAMFLYRHAQISPARFQIVQQTSPFDVPEFFTAWGTTAATFERGVADRRRLRRAFLDSRRAQLPVRSWSALRSRVNPETLDAFTSFDDVIQSAAVVDGTLYRTDCPTAAGPYPYCDAARWGVWSVTKSAMLNVATLRLAEKYGPGFLQSSVAAYLPGAAALGWGDVTFGDLANMASGHGPAGDGTCYLCDYTRWYLARSESAKTTEALDYPSFTTPGTLYNYRDQDAYLLGVAQNALLKAHEGASANIWDMLRTEVYRPIGIYAAPANSTIEPGGSPGLPLMAYGYYPTLDDLAKIAALYQNKGAWNGDQILSRQLVRQLLPRDTVPAGALIASGDGSEHYLLDWHVMRVSPDDDCTRYVPQMSGWGGITATVLKRRATLIRMRNNWVGDSTNPQDAINTLANAIAPMCGGVR